MSDAVKTRSRRVMDLLARLVDKSLVVYEQQPGKIGRYRLLETTRQYAREILKQNRQETALRARHRDFIVDQLESGLDPQIDCYAYNSVWRPHRPDYYNWCEAERDNCREALRFSLEEPDGGKVALRLGVRLFAFWLDRAVFEGISWLDAALQKDDSSVSHERIAALYCATVLAEIGGDSKARQRFAEERMALARRDGHLILLAHALNELAKTHINSSQEAEAGPMLEEALDLSVRSQDRHIFMYTKASIAQVKQREGALKEALHLFMEVLDFVREVRNPGWTSFTHVSIASIQCLLGNAAATHAHYAEAIRLFQRGEDPKGVITTLVDIAIVRYKALPVPTKQDAEWTARLLGAIQRQRELLHLTPFTDDSAINLFHGMDSILRIRATLGEEGFAAIQTEGRAMTLEEAVEFALQGIDAGNAVP